MIDVINGKKLTWLFKSQVSHSVATGSAQGSVINSIPHGLLIALHPEHWSTLLSGLRFLYDQACPAGPCIIGLSLPDCYLNLLY